MTVDRRTREPIMATRLILSVRSVEPCYKVMLWPHAVGGPIPTTSWDRDRRQVTTGWADQTDVVSFTPDARLGVRIEVTQELAAGSAAPK